MKKGDCSILLTESLETYYWIGFILADGHIHNNVRLKVALAAKDKEHLLKLKAFLKVENYLEYPTYSEFSIMDSVILRKFCKKFSIEQNKTEKAANLSRVSKTKLKALFIGFIDGDGSINKQSNRDDHCLQIKCHAAWLDNLTLFSKQFLQRDQAYLNKLGYAVLHIGTKKVLQDLKQFATIHNLPKLERKWNKIK